MNLTKNVTPTVPTSTCPTIFVSTEPKLMAQLTTCRQSSTTNFWVISHWNKFRAYFNWYHTAWMNLLDTRASSKLLSKVADAICPTAVVPCCRVRLYGMKQYGVQWQQLVETMTNMLLSLNDSYLTYFIFFLFALRWFEVITWGQTWPTAVLRQPSNFNAVVYRPQH